MSGIVGHRGLLLGSDSPPPSGGAYWNPLDKAAGITLSDSDKKASRSSGTLQSVRGVTGRSTGKFYFEVATDVGYASVSAAGVNAALASGSCSLTAFYIFGSPGAPYVCWRGNSQYGNDVSGYLGAHAGAGWAGSDGARWIGLACDLDARSVTMYDNGISRGAVSYGSGGGAMYPLVSLTDELDSARTLALRVLGAEFSGSIPVGYAAWGA